MYGRFNFIILRIYKKTAFTFNISKSEYYMIEAWHYDGVTKKLAPTVVKYV